MKNKMPAAPGQANSPHKQQKRYLASATDEAEHCEMQEVQNLPFESAKLKAEHFHWSENCSNGIQQMLTRRQHRHDAALEAYLTTRFAFRHMHFLPNACTYACT